MADLRLDNGTRIVLYRMSKRARRLQTDEVLENARRQHIGHAMAVTIAVMTIF